MKRIRTVIALFLAVLLFVSSGVSAQADNSPEDDAWLSQVEAQAISLAMAFWLNGVESSADVIPDYVYWDAAGWYAARLNRIEGRKLLSWLETDVFLASIGYEGEPVLPSAWEAYEIVKIVRGAGGSVNYDFVQNKRMFENMIGVDTELSLKRKTEDSVVVTITVHTGGGERKQQYLVAFDPNTAGSPDFPYRVTHAEAYADGPDWDERLSFTWDLLLEQNRLSTILSMYPGVRVSNPGISEDACTWLFLHNGNYAMVNDYGGVFTGIYDMYSFDVVSFPDGKDRASVTYMDRDSLYEFKFEEFMYKYIEGFDRIVFNRTERDLIWVDLISDYGYSEQLAVDAGTLVLRKILYIFGDGDPILTNEFDYRLPVPDFPFLNSWNDGLRTVTAIWEDVDKQNGGYTYRTETIGLPYDWEYLPNSVRYDEYTAYLNPRFVGSYQYPGDVYDYTVYFTAAKG